MGDAKGKGREANEKTDLANSFEREAPNGSSEPANSTSLTIASSKPHSEPPPDASSVTRIQFRHPNGRVVRRFALANPVRRIFEWLKASPLEGKAGIEFELIFMGKNLIGMLDDSIEQAGLKNGTVMIELIES